MIRRRIAVGLAAFAAMCGAAAVITTSAGAWAYSSQVTLTGTVKVVTPSITGVYVTGSDGEQGWATLGSGNGYWRAYSFKFNHVGSGSGISVRYTIYTSGVSYSGSLGVARPSVGANAVRDLCQAGLHPC